MTLSSVAAPQTPGTSPAGSIGSIRRIGVLGGTFDPIHTGHLALGALFARTLALDELILMPAGQQPQKQGSTPAGHRLAMTRLAAETLAAELARTQPATQLIVSTREIERAGPSYTVDTLRELRRDAGAQASLSLLIGSDQLVRLDTWHAWRELFNYANICAAARPGFNRDSASPQLRQVFAEREMSALGVQSTPCGGILIDDSLAVDISATELRATLAHARDAATPPANLPEPVWQYIRAQHLYRA
ncbi:nicotinate-nucleotide adenylyltransferase [Pandoraea apista]|uniref:Probable nicotinate-nucleotide adenylyltransferase n=1 Tax=Pandoraea apista TaxID=93218 RepID=A0ABX9ZRN5_9BURK|nr:nicotinate-nucleotide adenylyltransferase [Pandoraea apista]PTE01880.1 nicotinate-nucleotide adenylyltransferase [Pandoraea apista]RRJ34149.1 nicotinate-nucleotide adenylyltransferase [Pandoraea apista]RRJ80460.1 nicotinate-nucleotide adenylyltransferase [Pandoraea apista]RSD15883.1 nicotinate-nucleotide adenylyltransferase [Pandoraea apista]RSD21264.1 nicotinate-nucleotide adenylyltransferase [Pandoraea apista]